jgi:long-chain acyl-CoA synthetase
MIVTEGGKNIYPEDIENAFEGLPVKELCVFAANYIWPERSMTGEKLIVVFRLEQGQSFDETLKSEIVARNRVLPDFKRLSGYVLWDEDFPRTASLKIKRNVLADVIRGKTDRDTIREL